MHKLLILSIVCVVWSFQSILSQTPGLLPNPVPYDSNTAMSGNQSGYSNVGDIQTAFNNARRGEEMQLCFPLNSIVDMVMPSQSIWDNMSSDEKFLFLINEERTSRAGIDYCQGDGPVQGIAFIGVEANIDGIAQAHADSLIAVQSLQQTNQRYAIDLDPNIGGSGCTSFKGTLPDCCHSFLPVTGASYSTTSFANPTDPSTIVTVGLEVQVIYQWVYGFGSNNGLRDMILLQDIKPGNTPADPCGFVDDYGAVGEEGFIGIGVAAGIPDPATTNETHVDLVIFLHFDPVPQLEGCNYDCTTCETCPSTIVETSVPIPSNVYQASNWILSNGTVQAPSVVDMFASNFVELTPQFEVSAGAMFHAYIDGCYFTLN